MRIRLHMVFDLISYNLARDVMQQNRPLSSSSLGPGDWNSGDTAPHVELTDAEPRSPGLVRSYGALCGLGRHIRKKSVTSHERDNYGKRY